MIISKWICPTMPVSVYPSDDLRLPEHHRHRRPCLPRPSCDRPKNGPHQRQTANGGRRKGFPPNLPRYFYPLYLPVFVPTFFVLCTTPMLLFCHSSTPFPASWVMDTRRQASLRQERRRAQAVDRHSRREISRQSFCSGVSGMSRDF